ncbi:MAG TPA: diiron oxygenase [Steroidobacteraceae bacterium]
MAAVIAKPDAELYARSIAASKAAHWDIDADVIRDRDFDLSRPFLPDSLSLAGDFTTLAEAERRLISQVQGRTYANIFGLVERFITAKLLEVGHEHSLGDQNALEALVRFSEEELKHQALFRRINRMMGAVMPPGYRFDIDPDEVARVVLGKSTWAVLALTLHIELFVQNHYRQSIRAQADLSDLFKDVFLFHWKDECQHVVLDELELRRHDATLTDAQRDAAVEDFLALVGAVDGILQVQARADAAYFSNICGRRIPADEGVKLEEQFLKAYRWQYIFSGASHPRFQSILFGLITREQRSRIEAALSALQRLPA